MLHKTEHDLPKAMVKLYRVDDWNRMAKSLINVDIVKLNSLSSNETTDSEITEIYEYSWN